MNGPWFIILFLAWPGTGMETREVNFVSEVNCEIGYAKLKSVPFHGNISFAMTRCIAR